MVMSIELEQRLVELQQRIDELEDVLDCAKICCRLCGSPVGWSTLIGKSGYCSECLVRYPHVTKLSR